VLRSLAVGADGKRKPAPKAASPKAPEPVAASAAAEEEEPAEAVDLRAAANQDVQVRALRLSLDARNDELNELDDAVRTCILVHKHRNAMERADAHRSKASELNKQNRVMRRSIDTARTADRTMANFQSSLDAKQKLLVLRSAHVRQKQATIALIARRCEEQAEQRRRMVDVVEEAIADAVDRAARREREHAFSATVDPFACMHRLLEVDMNREDDVVETIARMHDATEMHLGAARAVVGLHEAAAQRMRTDTDETEQEVALQLQRWAEDREAMQAAMVEQQQCLNELMYHVNRGTNYHWSSTVLPREELRPLRELLMSVKLHRSRLTGLQADVARLEKLVGAARQGHETRRVFAAEDERQHQRNPAEGRSVSPPPPPFSIRDHQQYQQQQQGSALGGYGGLKSAVPPTAAEYAQQWAGHADPYHSPDPKRA
jgi:hypothetical protein